MVRLLHLESGFSNPLADNWFLKTLLKGIDRDKGREVNRKLAVTPEILRKILNVVNLKDSRQLTFWTACLVGFYGMLRKSSLFPSQSSLGMTLQDCNLHSWGISINTRYSKTIQCRERISYVCLPWHSKPLLCPARTLLRLLSQGSPQEQDFIFSYQVAGQTMPIKYSTFTRMLKETFTKIKLSASHYSGHSFRRGGASFALLRGVPAEIIKEQVDWKSMCYLDYVQSKDRTSRAALLNTMSDL